MPPRSDPPTVSPQPRRRRETSTWTPAERVRATLIATEQGATAASAATGIPRTTLQTWLEQKADAVVEAEKAMEIVPAEDEDWGTRQLRAADRYEASAHTANDLADEMMAASKHLLQEGRSRDAQAAASAARSAMITSAIATDKASLLRGGATSRHESRTLRVDVAGERLAELLGQLPARDARSLPARQPELGA